MHAGVILGELHVCWGYFRELHLVRYHLMGITCMLGSSKRNYMYTGCHLRGLHLVRCHLNPTPL